MVVLLVLILVPQTGKPIKVALHKLISFAPSQIATQKQQQLDSYNWPLQTLQGNAVNFDQSKGRVVVLNLWATWCPPCIAEMPSFQALYDAYGDHVDFYFVTSEEPARVQAFLDKKGYTFPVFIKQYAAPNMLENNSLPTTYVINKAGAIQINKTGAANWNSDSVKELLNNLIATPIN